MPASVHAMAPQGSVSDAPRRAVATLFPVGLDTPTTTREAIRRHHRVRHFHGGFTKSEAYPNRGRAMAVFPFVQINPQNYLNFLVVDVDHSDAELRLLHPSLPQPHWIIVNPDNGHAQAGWMIEPVACGADARPAPQQYARAVLASLDQLVGGDQAFTRHLVRNPVADSPAGAVRFGARLDPYTLGDLMKHMQTYRDPFEPQFRAWNPHLPFSHRATIARQETGVGGRNTNVFQATRSFLWGRLLQDHIQPGYAAAHEYATALNSQLATPLPAKEIHELSASAVRQVLRGKGKPKERTGTSGGRFSEFCAAAGRRGGRATTGPKIAAARENAAKAREKRAAAARDKALKAADLKARGLTLKEISKLLERSESTVKRWLRSGQLPTEEQGSILQATGSVPPPPTNPTCRPDSSRTTPRLSALWQANTPASSLSMPPRNWQHYDPPSLLPQASTKLQQWPPAGLDLANASPGGELVAHKAQALRMGGMRSYRPENGPE